MRKTFKLFFFLIKDRKLELDYKNKMNHIQMIKLTSVSYATSTSCGDVRGNVKILLHKCAFKIKFRFT